MANADQIKSLIRSHFDSGSEQFYTIALQIAATEANKGHSALAQDIRKIVDSARTKSRGAATLLPQELLGLVFSEKPDNPRSSLVLPPNLMDRFERIILEYRQQHKLKIHGLHNRRKLMLIGPPGTGKTVTARVLAHELRLQLYTVQMDRLVTKFMGETSAKLRQIFDFMIQHEGIYLFDEFDAIGGERSRENDVGEMRRVLSSFLQFIESDHSDSIIITTTNSPDLLDRALFRRFDDVLYYNLPDEVDRKTLIQNVSGSFLTARFSWNEVIKKSAAYSHSEIEQACRDAIKHAILSNKNMFNADILLAMFEDRMLTHKKNIK